MSEELENKWREEFEEYFAATKPYQFSILKDKKKTEFEIGKLKFSIGYVSARKKAQEELKDKDDLIIILKMKLDGARERIKERDGLIKDAVAIISFLNPFKAGKSAQWVEKAKKLVGEK